VTATKLPDEPRRPDGVLVEPSAALPPSRDRAPADGVVALREPLPDASIATAARAYVRAIVREDRDQLDALLTPNARMLDGAHESIGERWLTRFRANDYARWAGQEIVRPSTIARTAYEDLAPDARPSAMREGDVLVSFPTSSTRAGTDAPFGGSVVLLLRREGARYAIAGASDATAP
jgi:hypothetical protein